MNPGEGARGRPVSRGSSVASGRSVSNEPALSRSSVDYAERLEGPSYKKLLGDTATRHKPEMQSQYE